MAKADQTKPTQRTTPEPAGRPEPMGHPDSGRSRTEDMLEKGMPPRQQRKGEGARKARANSGKPDAQ